MNKVIKSNLHILFIAAICMACTLNEREMYPTYTGTDLGLIYTPKKSSFRVWAPTATNLVLNLYVAPLGGTPSEILEMKKDAKGTWTTDLSGNHAGKYYAFSAEHNGEWGLEVPDPYAKAVGTNGRRGMIIDLDSTNPSAWEGDKGPVLENPTDAIIYELHVRDASIAANSGIKQKGKFLGITETGTTNPDGLATGLDHLVELGVTHVHLLPSYDFNSIDESNPTAQYNWGYDPQNYNTPEGSYSSNAADGSIRIREFKQLIQAFHQKGLGLIMDVVYNHTAATEASNFNQLEPDYYYRHNKDNSFSDATACGNETASEKPMMRKFMIESVLYWVNEYHVDGFRFDLMGVHDIETMNLIADTLRAIKPGILLYGEGWTAGKSPLPDSLRSLKINARHLNGIAVFSDDIRDGIKGSVFEREDKGFASGKPGMEESIKFGIVAACEHPQIDYSKVNYSKASYANDPGSTITYVECHDNHTLWDKLAISAPQSSLEDRIAMHKLALSIVLTSQGVSFLHAGTEFLRSKYGVENSYNAGDSINALDWKLKTINKEVFFYVQQLISMRKTHPAFRMITTEHVQAHIKFYETPAGIIGYQLNGKAVNDSWGTIQVWLNGGSKEQALDQKTLAGFKTAILNNQFIEVDAANALVLKPYSCSVFQLN